MPSLHDHAPDQEAPLQMSNIEYLLSAGGMPLLLFGAVLSIVGLLMATRPVNRRAIGIFAILSLLPGLLAAYGIYTGCIEFRAMAASDMPPKPADFAAVAGRAMSQGFWGIVGTSLPSFFAVIAFLRSSSDS